MVAFLQNSDNNNYHTGPKRRVFLDKLSLGSSFYFNLKFIKELFISRRLALAGKLNRETWVAESLEIMTLIEKCGGRFYIEGLENIDKIEGPVVFISNHMSILESMVFPGIIAARKPVTFVVKDSLVTHPLFGPVMKARKPISVERKDPFADFKKVMHEGVGNLENNISVVIFPQSVRTVEFDLEKFNKLGIKLAKRANVHIVPIAIKTNFWKKGSLVKDLGKIDRKLPIHIKFGEPFKVEGQGNKEHQMVMDFIVENLTKWQEEISH